MAHRQAREGHEAALNGALPPSYAARLHTEQTSALHAASAALSLSLSAGDFLLGVPHAMHELSAVLRSKPRTDDASRAGLARLLFRVTTVAGLPPSRRQHAAALLSHVLRRSKHMHALSLPWQPLWELLLEHHLPPDGPPTYASRAGVRSLRAELARAASQCRRHFTEEAATEMLVAAEPLLCPHDPARFMLVAGMLSLMLPTHGAASRTWLPAVLSLWHGVGVDGSAEYDGLWLGLLGRLVKDEFYGHAVRVDWAPLLPMIHSCCLRLLRLPGGQEASAQLRPSVLRAPWEILSVFERCGTSDALRAAARLLILTLPAVPTSAEPPPPPPFFADHSEAAAWRETQVAAASEEEECAAAAEGHHPPAAGTCAAVASVRAWTQLRQLLRCIEPYCHPSNSGSWSSEVGYFLQAIAQFSWWRVRVERSRPEAPSACGALPLGARDVWALACALEPLITQARYSKSGLLARCADSAAKYALRLAPELLLPILEAGVAEGLKAVTAVHQTSVALSTLASITPVLLGLWPNPQLPVPLVPAGCQPSTAALAALSDGPRAMRTMLELMLPGLDANDPRKTMLSLHAIDQLLLVAPLGAPGQSIGDEPARTSTGPHIWCGTRATPRSEAEAEAQFEAAAGGAALAEWLPDFAREALRRMLDSLEHQERLAKGGGSLGQRFLLVQWRATAALFWAQLSPPLHDELLNTLLALLPRSSLADASKHVGAHLAAAVLARPAPALSRVVPAMTALLLTPAGGLRPLSEGELVWLVKLLAQTVRCGGAALLRHMAVMRSVLSTVEAHAAEAGLRKVGKAAYKLRRRLLQALLSIYPCDLRSLPPRLRAMTAVRERPWEAWGWMPTPDAEDAERLAASLEMEWHEPSPPEVEAAVTLAEEAVGVAEALVARAGEPEACALSELQIRAALLMLRAVAKGALPYVADEDEGGDAACFEFDIPDGEGGEADAPMAPLRSVLPRAGRLPLGVLRVRVATTLERLAPALARREGSKAQLQLLRVCQVVLVERPSSLLGLPRQMAHATRQPTELRGAGAHVSMARGLLAMRLAARHTDRLRASAFGAAERCAALAPLIRLQLALCTHRYARVRRLAQEGYGLSLTHHPWLARQQLLPVIHNLHRADAEEHEVKASAYLLGNARIAPRIATDPPLLYSMLTALAKSRDHGRQSVSMRLRMAHEDVLRHVPPPIEPFALAVVVESADAAVIEAREKLAPVYRHAADVRAAARRDAYSELLSVAAVDVTQPMSEGAEVGGEDATHWSHEVSALSALLVVPAASPAERESMAVIASRALCSPTKAVRQLGRAMLLTLLRPPDGGARRAGSTNAPLATPGEVPDVMVAEDAPPDGPLWEDVAAGWCRAQAAAGMNAQGAGESATPEPLGSAADELLLSEPQLGRVLEWLVTDHKESDDAGGGPSVAARGDAPHEMVLSMLAMGRGWPYTATFCHGGCNFSFVAARLVERLTIYFGPAIRTRLLWAALALLAPGAKRDSLAVGLEALGGLVRGAGSWPAADRRELQDELAAPMAASLRACPVESLADWQICLRFIASCQDPRRLGWLVRLLLQNLEGAAAAHETSLAHANAMRLLAPLLAELSWRGASLIEVLLRASHMRDAVSNGSRQVREEIGAILALAMHATHPTPPAHSNHAVRISACVDDFVAHVVLECRLSDTNAEGAPLEPEGADERAAARAARGVALSCMRNSLMSGRPHALLRHVSALLPVALSAAACVGDPDLANAGRACAVLFSQAPLLGMHLLSPTLDEIVRLSSSTSWRMRGCLLPPLKYLAYLGQFAPLNPAPCDVVRTLLLGLIADAQLEVREAALPILAGFVRLYGSGERRLLLRWADTQLKCKLLPQRHAGVLALAAIVALAPYDVPAWLPEVLDRLGRFASEPQPLKAAVARTFADFKRTHQDNWAAHKQRLTLEQQDMLADAAVAPHWYA